MCSPNFLFGVRGNYFILGVAAAIVGAIGGVLSAPAWANAAEAVETTGATGAKGAKGGAGALTVENRLQECVTVHTGLRGIEHGMPLQRITLDVKKPIGECGCKSAILSYDSQVVLDGGTRTLLLQGRLSAKHSGPRTLPLASDATLAGDRPIVLQFDCTAPD